MEDLAGAEGEDGGEEIGEEGEETLQLVGADVDDQEAEAELLERVLTLDALVDGEEDIEVLFREREKLFIRYAAPSRLGDCFYRMTWKGSTGTSRDALV